MSGDKDLRPLLSGYGAVKEIAEITGYNVSYVRKVLYRERTNSLIEEVALELLAMQQAIKEKYAARILTKDKRRKKWLKEDQTERLLVEKQWQSVHLLLAPLREQLKNNHKPKGSATVEMLEYCSVLLEDIQTWTANQDRTLRPLIKEVRAQEVVQRQAGVIAIIASQNNVRFRILNTYKTVRMLADPYLAGLLLRLLATEMLKHIGAEGVMALSLRSRKGIMYFEIHSQPVALPQELRGSLEQPDKLLDLYYEGNGTAGSFLLAHYLLRLQKGLISHTISRGSSRLKIGLPLVR